MQEVDYLLAIHTQTSVFWLWYETLEHLKHAYKEACDGFQLEYECVDKTDRWMLARIQCVDDAGYEISIAIGSIIAIECFEQGERLRWQNKQDEFCNKVRAEFKPQAGFSGRG